MSYSRSIFHFSVSSQRERFQTSPQVQLQISPTSVQVLDKYRKPHLTCAEFGAFNYSLNSVEPVQVFSCLCICYILTDNGKVNLSHNNGEQN